MAEKRVRAPRPPRSHVKVYSGGKVELSVEEIEGEEISGLLDVINADRVMQGHASMSKSALVRFLVNEAYKDVRSKRMRDDKNV